MSTKMITGCGSIKSPEGLEFFSKNCLDVMSLSEMLTTGFRTDAHFVCYQVTNFPLWPRCNKGLLREIRSEGEDIVLPILAFDWDNPGHVVWDDSLLDSFARRIDAIEDDVLKRWHATYSTKHGARLIYVLDKPAPADQAEEYLTWMLRKFLDLGFNNIDPSCKDWTRCFRCPQVSRDGKRTEEEWSYFLQHRPEAILPVAELGKLPPKAIARKKEFFRQHYADHLPPHELDRLLVGVNPDTTKPCQTDYYKKAKKALKSSAYFDMIFNLVPPSWEQGTRNDEVLKMLGVITPILIKKCFATVHQIFALAIYPILTLPDIPGKTNPTRHAWNALLDIYERENNKANIEAEVAAERSAAEISLLDSIIRGMKEWCNHPELAGDEQKARDYCRTRCLATVGTYFFMVAENGYFDSFAINKDQVISRIRKSHLKDIIPTSKLNDKGEQVDLSTQVIQNSYSTSVCDIIMKPVGEKGGFITGIDGEKPALVLSTFVRNPKLVAERNPFVEQWLMCLFGKDYEVGCDWIGNALAFEDGLICALSLEGASNAGKKLLSVGLSECLKEPFIAGPMDIYGMSSAFLKTPFLVINEAWPDPRTGISPADTFKALTGGDGIRVKEIYKPAVTVLCPVRIILTANDDGIVRTLTKGKDMTLDNRIAIGQRLLHIKVPAQAQYYLQKIGGMEFTAKEGQRWIRPDSGNVESNYVVAKHFLWLYENRRPVNKSARFLVMGNSAPGCGDIGQMTVFEKLLADNNSTPIVAQAIIDMADKGRGLWEKYIRIDIQRARLWVTRYGVDKYVRDVLQQRVHERDLFSSMGNLLNTNEPMMGDDKNHWYEINVEALAMIAFERAIPQTVVGKLNEILKGIRAAIAEKKALEDMVAMYAGEGGGGTTGGGNASEESITELEEDFERKTLGI